MKRIRRLADARFWATMGLTLGLINIGAHFGLMVNRMPWATDTDYQRFVGIVSGDVLPWVIGFVLGGGVVLQLLLPPVPTEAQLLRRLALRKLAEQQLEGGNEQALLYWQSLLSEGVDRD
jgi:hypothetical protein